MRGWTAIEVDGTGETVLKVLGILYCFDILHAVYHDIAQDHWAAEENH
jgi:hypothetical protein